MTGRYPWGIGFYDMSNDGSHCVREETTMLLQLLKDAGYSTHAIGKWDVGRVKKHCTPTARGFDTFLGYYTACTSDYWYHGAPGGNATHDQCGGVDCSDSTVGRIAGASMSGPTSLNNTYDRNVFTDRAVSIISQHNTSNPLYLYLAFHNVHDSCTKDRFMGGLNAPKATVDLYATTVLDTWKVQAAMTTELDYGVGNVTHALQAAGMWDNTVLVFVSDNGGPLDHSTNAPLRGGKSSWLEGGLRVVSFVTSPLLPSARRGVTWPGMAHSSDWYVTFVESLAGGSTSNTGPRPSDGWDLWPALMGKNTTSPRTSVIHGVLGSQVVPPLSSAICTKCRVASMRFGDMKIILNYNGAKLSVHAWPSPGATAVPFGLTSGTLEERTDHCRAKLLAAVVGQEDWDARNGAVLLFNVTADVAESTNLAGDPKFAALVQDLKNRLEAAAKTGPAPAFVGLHNKTIDQEICNTEKKFGFLEPADWKN